MSGRIPFSAALSALGPLAICASWLALALTALSGAAGAADKLVLQLHRGSQFEFAGYYAALWQGFYREAGLEVEIKSGAPPGAPPIDPVREIVEGRAQFGTGTAQLLVRAAQGQSLLLLAPIFQHSDARVYYRSDGDFSSPTALLDGRVGRSPSSNIFDIELRTALYAEAIDPDKLRSLPIDPGQTLADLASHRVDAVVGSTWELPWQARERGIGLKSFNPAAYRVEYYGDGLFTLQRLAKTDPAMIRRFREASLKGWGYALQHSDEVAARVRAELPVQVAVSDQAGFTRYQTEVARKLAGYPDVPLGHANPERWGRIQRGLIEIGEITQPADLDAFLSNPGAAAPSRSDWPAAAVAAAAAVALLAGAGLLWRWRRGRSGSLLDHLRRYTWVRSARLRLTAVGPYAQNCLRTLRNRMSLQPRLADLVAAALDTLMRLWTLMYRFGLWFRLGRLRAAVSAASSRLVMMTRVGRTSGGIVSGPLPTDLNAMLTTLERSIRRRVPDSVKCRFSLLPEPWLCRADSAAVAATTLDLVSAAVADLPAGGDLIVGTRQYAIDDAAAAEIAGSAPGDYVRLTVKDNGPGLSPERLDWIFDPVATARAAVARAGELTRQLGGFARVESAEGIGTAVHLYFRRAVAASQGAQQPSEDDEHAKAAAA
jgi:ABC-type nitrate/sulfonate/bicarbonate transport system substrate-binding protein/signal transduction histidine kinase